MEEKDARQMSLELMKDVEDVYFSTVDASGFPQTRVMGNVRNKVQCPIAEELFADHDEDFLIYILSGKSTDKMKEVGANSKVSVYFCNSEEFLTLLLVGNVEEVDDPEFKKQIWQDEWKTHWPGGPTDPEFVVLKILPDHAKGLCKDGHFEFKLK